MAQVSAFFCPEDKSYHQSCLFTEDHFDIKTNEITPLLRFSYIPNTSDNYAKASQKHISMSIDVVLEGLKFKEESFLFLSLRSLFLDKDRFTLTTVGQQSDNALTVSRKTLVVSCVDTLPGSQDVKYICFKSLCSLYFRFDYTKIMILTIWYSTRY